MMPIRTPDVFEGSVKSIFAKGLFACGNGPDARPLMPPFQKYEGIAKVVGFEAAGPKG